MTDWTGKPFLRNRSRGWLLVLRKKLYFFDSEGNIERVEPLQEQHLKILEARDEGRAALARIGERKERKETQA
jgi:hypothetical protein